MGTTHVNKAIRSAVETIRGLRVTSTTSRRHPYAIGINLRITGWSPSLHALAMEWTSSMPTHGTLNSQIHHVLCVIAPYMAIQRTRMALAETLGIEDPLPAGRRSRPRVDHLKIDRGVADLMMAGGVDVERTIRKSIVAIHGNRDSGLRENLPYIGSSIHGLLWSCDHGSRDSLLYDGRTVVIRDVEMPETLIDHAQGRRLREVASAPDAIADHVVEEVRNTFSGLEIDLRPRPVRVADIIHIQSRVRP